MNKVLCTDVAAHPASMLEYKSSLIDAGLAVGLFVAEENKGLFFRGCFSLEVDSSQH